MGWFSDMLFGKRKSLSIPKIEDYMQPAQDLVTKQVDLSQSFLDPESTMNQQLRQMLSQQSLMQGQSVGNQMKKMGAMRNMSSAQTMMQARMGMNQAMGQGQQQWMQGLQDQYKFGSGLLADATYAQTGLSENIANAYVSKISGHNAARANRASGVMNLAGTLGSAWIAASDKELKENIELVGKSYSGTNIYEFDYKDKEGRYRGVIAQEVPEASIKGNNGYLMVDYSKVDVNFERIS